MITMNQMHRIELLMKFPCTLKNALLIIRDRFGLSFASKGLVYLSALLLLLSLLARYKLPCYQSTLLLTISALSDITLLKTTCHFLLLLVEFDTLTYRKELQLMPYTCGSSRLFYGAVAGEWSAFGKETFIYIVCWNLLSLVTMENNPLKGLFGVSSPRPEPQLSTPQPTIPTKNIEYETPSGMI